MHCLGLDQQFQLAKIPVQTLGGTPDGDYIETYTYMDMINDSDRHMANLRDLFWMDPARMMRRKNCWGHLQAFGG